MNCATATAHPNIALVKYWGKRDVALNLPAVPSLSLTLAPWSTRTTVETDAPRDEVRLAGRPATDAEASRVTRFLDLVDPDRPPCVVDSANDFPTAAGLASSASAFAALALAATEALGHTRTRAELSALARRGSGSACRSLWGGFVRWDRGTRADGADSCGHPVAGPDHWDLRMVVAIVSDGPKPTASTAGMLHTARTSPLYAGWVASAEATLAEAQAAVLDRDLERLGRAMEQSTFTMHATMHTSDPPLIYWLPATLAVVHAVQALRRGGVGAWATMDAGPQVKVLCEVEDADTVQRAIAPHALRTAILGPGRDAHLEPAC